MKKIDTRTFEGYRFVSHPRISPCGTYTAFVVQTMSMEKNAYEGDIYLLNNESGSYHRLTAAGDAKSFIWSEDGKILFISDRQGKSKKAKEKGELLSCVYEICPCGGEASVRFEIPAQVSAITEMSAGVYMTTCTVDLNRPCFADMEESARADAVSEYLNPRYQVFEELPFWGNGLGYISRRRNALCIFDERSGELRAITDKQFDTSDANYKDGKILFTGAEFDSVNPIGDGLFVYDVKSGKTVRLIEQGKERVGCIRVLDADTFMAQIGDVASSTFETGDVYTLDIKGKRTKLCDIDAYMGSSSVGSDARLGGGITVKVEGERVWFVETMVNDSHLRTLDRSGKLSTLTSEGGAVDSFDVHGDRVIICAMRGNSLAELYALENGKERRLTHINDEYMETINVIQPEPFSYKGSDGVEIFGWVMKPAGYEKGKKYPSILHIHGGPRTVFGSVFHNEMQMWANAGYFVLFCNPRGGDGRGHDFANLYGCYASVDYVNLMEFTDECINRYPDIDTERMGVTGGSYGGFMTNWIVGHTDRFKAAATQRCISNWISFEGTSDIGYSFIMSQHGTNTQTDHEKLWDMSPLKYAKNVKTPLLFIHSEQDYRCWMVEALAFFTAVKMNGVPSRIALFHGDTHELSRSGQPRNRVKRMEEIVSWMDTYLKEGK